MDERKGMTFALLSGIVILGMSIFVAYICFNILDSFAEASLQNWKFGGAFAGFVFTASLMTSITLQVYKQMTTDRIEKYRDQIQELQTKLVKGAPCPEGYTIDIDEKHKLVFSRPQQWLPLNGILYQYIEKKDVSNISIANFNVIYQSEEDLSLNLGIDLANLDIYKLYETVMNLSIENLKKLLKLLQNANLENVNITQEFILVDNIKSLKWILTYTEVDSNSNENRMCQCGVYTYVSRLNSLYEFTFTDKEENYLISSEVFNNVIRSIRFL